MRILGLTMCLFMCMTVFSAMFYFYLVISQYIHSTAYESHKEIVSDLVKNAKYYLQSNGRQTNLSTEIPQITIKPSKAHPQLTAIDSQIKGFKNKLIVKLRRYEMESMNVFHQKMSEQNHYSIPFNKGQKSKTYPELDLLCKINFDIINDSTSPFNTPQFESIFPKIPFKKVISKKIPLKNDCALVSSAASINNSNSGQDIDKHQLVIRFNDAPTQGFETDVGSKTTIRILNSQVLSRSDFNITDLKFANSINIVWDPSHYDANLKEWIEKPDFKFWPNYRKCRLEHPEIPFYVLHPKVLWNAWDILQKTTINKMPKTPPSSGFIGLILLVQICKSVSLYEYIPSIRITDYCHYYDNTSSIGCSFGDWHPLSTEKLFTLSLNKASDYNLIINGKTILKGCKS